MGMLEARECQPEVIEPMRQRDASNRDAERARVCEVGQAKTAGRVLLPEDDIPFWAGQSGLLLRGESALYDLRQRTKPGRASAHRVRGKEWVRVCPYHVRGREALNGD